MKPPLGKYLPGAIVCFALALTLNPIACDLVVPGSLSGSRFEFALLAFFFFLAAGILLLTEKKNPPEALRESGPISFLIFISAAIFLLITNPLFIGKLQVLRLGFVLFLIFLLTRWFYIFVVKKQQRRGWIKNVLTIVYAVFFLFLGAEGVFMFIPKTVGSTASLSSQLWFARYWNPINEAGFRDEAIAGKEKKKKIFFVGDSFPAGQGIKNYADRFPDQFRKLTDSSWAVFNLGDCGADVDRNYENMIHYPLKPDVIVLSWFINDMEGAAEKAGKKFSATDLESVHPFFRFLLLRSYVLNYIYSSIPFGHDFGYAEWLEEITMDPAVIARHRESLMKFVRYSKENEVPLIVLFFPVLQEPRKFHDVLLREKEFLDARGIQTLDLFNLVSSLLDPAERVVNQNDDHPSVRLHKILALDIKRVFGNVFR